MGSLSGRSLSGQAVLAPRALHHPRRDRSHAVSALTQSPVYLKRSPERNSVLSFTHSSAPLSLTLGSQPSSPVSPLACRGHPGVTSPARYVVGTLVSRAWPEYGIHAPDLPGLLIPTDRQDGYLAEYHLKGVAESSPPQPVFQGRVRPDQGGCGEPGAALTFNLVQCS